MVASNFNQWIVILKKAKKSSQKLDHSIVPASVLNKIVKHEEWYVKTNDEPLKITFLTLYE